MNAVQISRSNLLNKLRDFYALVVRLKREIEVHGAEISVDRVQGELRSFVDTELRAQGADEANYQLFDAMRGGLLQHCKTSVTARLVDRG